MYEDHIYVASNLEYKLYIFIIIFSGPPNGDGVDALLLIKVKNDKAKFSLTVSDSSREPAKEILYYLKVMRMVRC